ncbi:MAG TPA: BolA family protein [Methylophilus sp.]|nr:BolA family protein [Methylophilus sp.]HQQ33963.1 BolA family protein [Methylophilus sp.]
MSLTHIIKQRLNSLDPLQLDIHDDSAQHAGHAGNQGGGHFRIEITSLHFSQKSHIMRHRLIYQALSDLIPNKIHALSIVAIAPDDPK